MAVRGLLPVIIVLLALRIRKAAFDIEVLLVRNLFGFWEEETGQEKSQSLRHSNRVDPPLMIRTSWLILVSQVIFMQLD